MARIILVNKEKEVAEHLYVDSGADISLISKSLGDWLGFNVEENDRITEIRGIGEVGIPIIIKNLKIRIGEKLFDTRVAWALIEEVPLLLGREDVFNLFDICFKKNKKTVFID